MEPELSPLMVDLGSSSFEEVRASRAGEEGTEAGGTEAGETEAGETEDEGTDREEEIGGEELREITGCEDDSERGVLGELGEFGELGD